MSFQLNSTQQSIVNNLLALQSNPDEFIPALTATLLENEQDFTFDECEEICVYYVWA